MERRVSLLGQLLHDTYRIESLIGRGGMGEVYLASHLRLPRRFAIKVLYTACNPQEISRFRREAEVVSAIGHPHIVEVIDFNYTTAGAPYIVMEHLEGEDLGERLKRERFLTVRETAAILRQAASALHAAHRQGVIHRDLKPRNIFLCSKGGEEDWVKVVDFGLSKVTGRSAQVTMAQMAIGTPRYMAPEQALGHSHRADARTDVFAMGVILYRMLSAQLPFRGKTVPVVLQAIVHTEPPPLDELVPGMPEAICRTVERAMRKNPDERFTSMEALAEAFAAAADGVRDQLAPTDPSADPTHELALPSHTTTLSSADLEEDELFDLAMPTLVPTVDEARAPQDPTAETSRHQRVTAGAMEAAAPPTIERQAPRSDLQRRLRLPGLILAAIATASGGIWAGLRLIEGAGPGTAPDAGPWPGEPLRPAASTVPLDPPSPDLTVAADDPDLETPGQRVRYRPRRPGPDRLARCRLNVITRSKGAVFWADLYLDGKRVGQAPLVLPRVPAGVHRLEARRPGYRTATRKVTLCPKRDNKVFLDLD